MVFTGAMNNLNGCGQLFAVQEFAKNNPHIMHKSSGYKILCKTI